MKFVQNALDAAVSDGVISADQKWKLSPYFDLDNQTNLNGLQGSGLISLDSPRDIDDQTTIQESEAPRFVRGFHDVLITIGVVIVLFGLGSLTNFIIVGISAWVLAEVLVKKLHLALPAVILTLVFAISSALFVAGFVDEFQQVASVELDVVVGTGLFALLLTPFYWRFRVPIALSIMITAVHIFVFSILLLIIAKLINVENLFVNGPIIANIIGLVASLVLFAIAMWFDLKDRMREKRWSDVAFWLHLITAPVLLSSVISLLLYKEGVAFWWTKAPTLFDALIAILCVLAMMVVGLIIDRRAFVTSGLISLIAAAIVIFESSNMALESTISIAFLVVGLMVLAFGIGWQFLRRQTLKIVPTSIVDLLPIVR